MVVRSRKTLVDTVSGERRDEVAGLEFTTIVGEKFTQSIALASLLSETKGHDDFLCVVFVSNTVNPDVAGEVVENEENVALSADAGDADTSEEVGTEATECTSRTVTRDARNRVRSRVGLVAHSTKRL